ncbi:hypothetical protein BH09VER1_BH09VER1_38220 [soil metagenome]
MIIITMAGTVGTTIIGAGTTTIDRRLALKRNLFPATGRL